MYLWRTEGWCAISIVPPSIFPPRPSIPFSPSPSIPFPSPLPTPLPRRLDAAPSSSSPPRRRCPFPSPPRRPCLCPDASTPPRRPRPRPPPPVTAAPPPLSSQILLGSLLPVPLSHAFFFFNPNPNLNPLYSGAPHLSHPIGDLLTIPPPALRRTKELLVWEQAGYVSPLPIRVLLQFTSSEVSPPQTL